MAAWLAAVGDPALAPDRKTPRSDPARRPLFTADGFRNPVSGAERGEEPGAAAIREAQRLREEMREAVEAAAVIRRRIAT